MVFAPVAAVAFATAIKPWTEVGSSDCTMFGRGNFEVPSSSISSLLSLAAFSSGEVAGVGCGTVGAGVDGEPRRNGGGVGEEDAGRMVAEECGLGVSLYGMKRPVRQVSWSGFR